MKTIALLALVLLAVANGHANTRNDIVIGKALNMLHSIGRVIDRKNIECLPSADEVKTRFGENKHIQIAMTSEMFVVGTSFPIYINTWTPFWERAVKSQDQAYIAVIAAKLAHELVHAKNERRESEAYAEELRVLRELERKGVNGIGSAIDEAEQFFAEEKDREAE